MTSTGVLRVDVVSASAKVRVGGPGDDRHDLKDEEVVEVFGRVSCRAGRSLGSRCQAGIIRSRSCRGILRSGSRRPVGRGGKRRRRRSGNRRFDHDKSRKAFFLMHQLLLDIGFGYPSVDESAHCPVINRCRVLIITLIDYPTLSR